MIGWSDFHVGTHAPAFELSIQRGSSTASVQYLVKTPPFCVRSYHFRDIIAATNDVEKNAIFTSRPNCSLHVSFCLLRVR